MKQFTLPDKSSVASAIFLKFNIEMLRNIIVGAKLKNKILKFFDKSHIVCNFALCLGSDNAGSVGIRCKLLAFKILDYGLQI